MQNDSINPYEQERRQKRDRLRELGADPYGRRQKGVRPLLEIRSAFEPGMGHDGGPVVIAAGRVMLKRDMGKLSFLTLRDASGDLQVAVDRRRVDERSWEVRGLVDLGDWIVAEGPLGQTNKGEVTVWSTRVEMAAKALHPPPAKWEGLADVELRYRQRYVDLFTNPQVMRVMKLRSRIVEEVRSYLRGLGYLEVETPMLQPMHGGAAARPFVTHHNALDMPLYLRIAPELYLKRLLVGGFAKVFELNRNFRNEGISPRHNPEFTMLEAYEAFGDYTTMAEMVEGLVCHVAEAVCGTLRIEHRDEAGQVKRTIDLSRPWRRVRMVDLVEERVGWRFDKRPLQEVDSDLYEGVAITLAANLRDELPRIVDEALRTGGPQAFHAAILSQATVQFPDFDRRAAEAAARHVRTLSPAEQLVEVYEKLIEPTLIDPCFVTHLPSLIIPLARENAEDAYFCDVYELAINGTELSPGYTELNDPEEQARRFAHQVGDAAEQQKVDQDFLTALRYGMPPAGGMGLGIDRLVMLLSGAESIRDVILFPLMRPAIAGNGRLSSGPAGFAGKEGKDNPSGDTPEGG